MIFLLIIMKHSNNIGLFLLQHTRVLHCAKVGIERHERKNEASAVGEMVLIVSVGAPFNEGDCVAEIFNDVGTSISNVVGDPVRSVVVEGEVVVGKVLDNDVGIAEGSAVCVGKVVKAIDGDDVSPNPVGIMVVGCCVGCSLVGEIVADVVGMDEDESSGPVVGDTLPARFA